MNERLTLQDLIDLLSEQRKLTKKETELFLRELVALISETIEENEPVRVKDFGTFKLTKVSARKSVDVNTGDPIEIPAHYRLTFTPDKSLRDEVNAPFAQFESVPLADGVNFDDEIIVDELLGDEEEDFIDNEDIELATSLLLTKEDQLRENIADVLAHEDNQTNDIQEVREDDTLDSTHSATPTPILVPFDLGADEDTTSEIINIDTKALDTRSESAMDANVPISDESTDEIDTLSLSASKLDKLNEVQNPILVEKEEALPEEENNDYNTLTTENYMEELKDENREEKNEIDNQNQEIETQEEQTIQQETQQETMQEEEIQKETKEETQRVVEDDYYDEDDDLYDSGSNKRMYIYIALALIAVGLIFYFYRSTQASQPVPALAPTEATTTTDSINNTEAEKLEIVEKSEEISEDKIEKKAEDKIEKKAEKKVDKKADKKIEKKADKKSDKKAVSSKATTSNTIIGNETITPGQTLRKISLKYYGHKAFWGYIYKANVSKIQNPNNVPIGVKLSIPALSDYGVSVKNKDDVQRAYQLEQEILRATGN